MSREFQDDRECITNFITRKIDEFICIGDKLADNVILDVFVIWLKFCGESCWHRIFLDAGHCFVEAYQKHQDVDAEDTEGYSAYYLCDRFQLKDSSIISATVEPFNLSGVKLEIILDSRYLIIIWCNSINSDVGLLVQTKSNQ